MSSTPDPLAARLISRLADDRLTLATSESLTGGLIGAALTSVPGASQAYLGGVIAYATALKAVLSGVAAAVLDRHGAVSAETVTAMAQGVRRITGADWGLAVSGVAGPSPQEGQPPGTVWIAVAGDRPPGGGGLGLTGGRGGGGGAAGGAAPLGRGRTPPAAPPAAAPRVERAPPPPAPGGAEVRFHR